MKKRVVRVKMPRKHKRQIEAVRAYLSGQYRYLILRWGRRGGKTKLASEIVFGEALQGKKAFWVVPEYKFSNVAWRNLKHLTREMRRAGWIKANEQERVMEFPNDGWVQVMTVKNPDNVRSEGVHLAVVDETASIRHWDEVWQALRPSLTDYRGKVIFIGTPKGKNHFYDLWMEHEDAPDWFLSHMPSWENPFLPKGEIEEARRTLPDLIFRQEYGAEFVDVAGAFFKRAWLEAWADAAPPKEEMVSIARGWDVAITPDEGDYTVGAKVGMDKEGRLWVLDIVRGRWDWPTVVQTIRDTALRDGNEVMQGIEAVGVQKGVWQTLEREPALAGVALFPIHARVDKTTRALPLLSRAKAGRLVLLRRAWTQDLVDEMLAFPLGEHDDQVDAVAMAVQMLASGQVWTVKGVW